MRIAKLPEKNEKAQQQIVYGGEILLKLTMNIDIA